MVEYMLLLRRPEFDSHTHVGQSELQIQGNLMPSFGPAGTILPCTTHSLVIKNNKNKMLETTKYTYS